MCFRISGPRCVRMSVAILAAACAMPIGFAQTDPGLRGGQTAGVPPPVDGLTKYPNLLAAFQAGLASFQEVEDVRNDGLGPRFNSNSCVSCHSQPEIGGTSPSVNPLMGFVNNQNPQPYFLVPTGPAREARFIRNSDGTPDGGVHALFTIMGNGGPFNCSLKPEDFSRSSNIITRIPTPTFGLGLVEAIQDSTLADNLAKNAGAFGISGRLNRNGNDGTVTRFGWKAQNKSLLLFAAEAYNVEMGISNLLFTNERDETPNCSPIAAPNDIFNLGGKMDSAVFDDIVNFANFMRFLAPPSRGNTADMTVAQGSTQFMKVGCAQCHSPTLQTGPSPFPPLANQTIHPYSDFALHAMGPGLADQISQGLAAGDEFRTAPLWGVGQRLFFLHDGRTSDLLEAIKQHASSGVSNVAPTSSNFKPSEATQVIRNFFNLSTSDQQAILKFLRSL